MSEGKKFDMGKPRLAEMIKDFAPAMREIARVWAFGADKYEASNWKYVEDGINRYTNAMLRHLLQEDEYPYDRESNLLHATHVAWNAIARLYLILQNTLTPVSDFIDRDFDDRPGAITPRRLGE